MLSLNPILNKQYRSFVDEAVNGGVLPDRERAVALIAAALTLGDSDAVKDAVLRAKHAGLSNEEIGHVSALAVAIRGHTFGTASPVQPLLLPLALVLSLALAFLGTLAPLRLALRVDPATVLRG